MPIPLLGVGPINLIGDTGAALGTGIGYFAIAETAVAVLRPAGQPRRLSTTAGGLVTPVG